MTTKEHLEEILNCTLLTIQSSTFLEPIDEPQEKKFKEIISFLTTQAGDNAYRAANLVFRGEKLENLAKRLSNKPHGLNLEKISSLLFYFGEKARHYYKHEDTTAMGRRWLLRIEDTSEATCNVIFNKISEVLTRKQSLKFRKSNRSFAEFFTDDNRERFVAELANDQTARDYYLFFLHSASSAGLGCNTVLVSSSLSYDVPFKYQKDEPDGCIIYYIVPEPLEKYSISHLRMFAYDETLKARGLPIYETRALWPDEDEVAIRGALFSSFILGLRTTSDNHFIANPHLFSEENGVESIISGLNFDQSDFMVRLSDTGYSCGVGTRLDGYFRTMKLA